MGVPRMPLLIRRLSAFDRSVLAHRDRDRAYHLTSFDGTAKFRFSNTHIDDQRAPVRTADNDPVIPIRQIFDLNGKFSTVRALFKISMSTARNSFPGRNQPNALF